MTSIFDKEGEDYGIEGFWLVFQDCHDIKDEFPELVSSVTCMTEEDRSDWWKEHKEIWMYVYESRTVVDFAAKEDYISHHM